MSEPRELETPEEDGATLVTPRFDEEETVLAQPVVPLDAAAEEAPPGADAPAPYAPQPRTARRQWPLALILVSALAGSVLGGGALYFVQKQRRSTAATPAPAETIQPQPAPAVEQAAEVAPEPSAPAEAPPVDEPAETPADTASEDTTKRPPDDDDDDRRAERAPAPVPDAATSKRGKKAEHEDDDRRGRGRRDSREEEDDDAPAPSRREARRIDSITYPTRREERRAERRAQRRAERRERRAARNVDRVRAIFEGQP